MSERFLSLCCAAILLGPFAAFGAFGCQKSAEQRAVQDVRDRDRAEQSERRRLERQAQFVATLPTGAADVRDEGGTNVSFVLTRDGQSHRYLAYYSWDGRNGVFHSSLVRLN